MNNAISNVTPGVVHSNVPKCNPDSKLQTYGFVIVIILSIGGLGVGAGALSNMTKLDAIILMTACGGSGVILLIICNAVKHRKNLSHQPNTISSSTHIPSLSTVPIDTSQQSIDTKDGVFYGPEAWGRWNIKVVEVAPPPPNVDLKGKVLFYVPREVICDNIKKDFTLKTFDNILCSKKIGSLTINGLEYLRKDLQNIQGSGKWVLIDKNVPDPSMRKDLDHTSPQQRAESENCSLPSLLEAAVLNLMVYAFTGKEAAPTFCFEPGYPYLNSLMLDSAFEKNRNELAFTIRSMTRYSKQFLYVYQHSIT